jgi:hypothetical protein
MDQWRITMKTVMNIWIIQKENLSTQNAIASITFWRTVVHAGSLYRSCMQADTVLNLSTNLRESNQT